MRVAVIGSRTLNVNIEDYMPDGVTLIVSGGARGIDTLAENYARAHGIPTLIFKPDYDAYGRRAPLIRNHDIVDNADLVLALWDGKSRGTKYAIDYAHSIGKPVKLFTDKQ